MYIIGVCTESYIQGKLQTINIATSWHPTAQQLGPLELLEVQKQQSSESPMHRAIEDCTCRRKGSHLGVSLNGGTGTPHFTPQVLIFFW